MSRRVPDTERFGKQNADRETQRRGLRDALRIDGSQFVRLYEKMQALIADLETTVTNLVNAITYTTSEIDSKIASPGAISPTNVSMSGAFNCVNAYNFDITYTRRTAWLGNDGRLGWASSSRDKKTAIRPATVNVDGFLSLEPQWFEYKAQHEWKQIAANLPEDDPRYNPDYTVPTEIGLIAEDLVAAGLGEFVIYDGEGNSEGIEYSMLVVPLLATARAQEDRIREQAVQIRELQEAVADLRRG